MSDYRDILNLEELAKEIISEINDGSSKVNLIKKYRIAKNGILENKILEHEEIAKKWASEERPEELFFSHGEYRKGSLTYISEELKEKKTSNRAMYSLINSEKINKSKDEPIPSFVLFQCLFEPDDYDTLYCNVYFRALEVSQFLRINLEEIRQNIEEIISKGLDVKYIKLLIFAARAHHNSNFIPLQRPEIDTISTVQLSYIVSNKEWVRLAELLRGKAGVQSIVQLKSLKDLKEAFDLVFTTENERAKKLLESSLISGEKLLELRMRHSHSEDIDKMSENIEKNLIDLAEELESW